MVDSFSVPESLLVKEQKFFCALDAEDHFPIDQPSYCFLAVISFSENVLQTNKLQIANLRFLCRNLSPDRDLLIQDFFSVRQQLHFQH